MVASMRYLVIDFGGGAIDALKRTVHTPEGVLGKEALGFSLPASPVVHTLDACVVPTLMGSLWCGMDRTPA